MPKNKSNLISGNALGFGNHPTMNNQRMLNRDGSTNIRRKGLPFFRTSDTYNKLIDMSWTKFLLIVLAAYICLNLLFAYLYVLIGIEHLYGTVGRNSWEHFLDAFFFSAQTISTVGYGHISPRGTATSLLAAFESMMGLLAFALATGLLYGRFSRPSARIVYSRNLLLSPYGEGKALMFRMANYRSSQLIDLEIQVLLSMNANEEGKIVRQFWPLELERHRINLLTLSWTVVHPVNEQSPIFGLSPADLDDSNAEFIILLKAFDDTFSQTVHSRTSYQNEEIVWNARFKPVIESDIDGVLTLNMPDIHAYELL